MQENISAHAQSDSPAFFDPGIIQQRESIQGALPMSDRFLRIRGSSVTASVRKDEPVLAREFVAARVGPILMATCTSV